MKQIVFGIGLMVGWGMVGGCGGESTPSAELIRPVRYEKVFNTGGSRVRIFSGTAQAGTRSQLSFKVAGTVKQVAVNVGDTVGKNELIALLDDSDYRLQVQESEASLAQAMANERNARSSYERTQALWENASASKQDLDAAQAAFESASAQVRSIEKRLELARLQVDYTRLTAPFAGAVAEVLVESNENVQAGQAIVVLTSDEKPEVSVAIPGALISQIQTGSSASVTFDAIDDKIYPATVTEVGVTSTGFATTFPVTVCLNSSDSMVRPGMAAEVSFRFETAGTQERLIVPTVAVGEDHRGRFAFVIEELEEGLGVARRREVRVGDLTSDGLEILSGLLEGELVITAGVSRIKDGQRVKLL
jgi:RND family efflux transporter MFP subunit